MIFHLSAFWSSLTSTARWRCSEFLLRWFEIDFLPLPWQNQRALTWPCWNVHVHVRSTIVNFQITLFRANMLAVQASVDFSKSFIDKHARDYPCWHDSCTECIAELCSNFSFNFRQTQSFLHLARKNFGLTRHANGMLLLWRSFRRSRCAHVAL